MVMWLMDSPPYFTPNKHITDGIDFVDARIERLICPSTRVDIPSGCVARRARNHNAFHGVRHTSQS